MFHTTTKNTLNKILMLLGAETVMVFRCFKTFVKGPILNRGMTAEKSVPVDLP